MNLPYSYTCNQCSFETDDSLVAYTHLIRSNQNHTMKCVACDLYTNDKY